MVNDLRKAVQQARDQYKYYRRRTILFVDEIHRFNKVQQDALLPHVEAGTIVLVGATTENPSFAIIAALLSRVRVFELKVLAPQDIVVLLERAIQNEERGLAKLGLHFDSNALETIAQSCQGDARRALDVLEIAAHYAVQHKTPQVDRETVKQALVSQTLVHDKSGEGHYNVVSAFIKSMRGSDPDAALYWMMRMLAAGEDPLFILRRMLIFASEDIGNADPNALCVAVAADTAFQHLGMPEGLHTLGHCCTYLACAPKSNACYKAWSAAQKAVKEYGALPVPRKLRNAVTKDMKAWGYGKGYRYPHNEGGYAVGEIYLPDTLQEDRYYYPTQAGAEKYIQQQLEQLKSKKKNAIE